MAHAILFLYTFLMQTYRVTATYALAHLLEHIIYRELGRFYTAPNRELYTTPGSYIICASPLSDTFLAHLATLADADLAVLIAQEQNVIAAEYAQLTVTSPARLAFTFACHGLPVGSDADALMEQFGVITSAMVRDVIATLTPAPIDRNGQRDFLELFERHLDTAATSDQFELVVHKYHAASLLDLCREKVRFLQTVFERFGTLHPGHGSQVLDACPELATSFFVLSVRNGITPFERITDTAISPNAKENERQQLEWMVLGSKQDRHQRYETKGQLLFGQSIAADDVEKIEKLVSEQSFFDTLAQ